MQVEHLRNRDGTHNFTPGIKVFNKDLKMEGEKGRPAEREFVSCNAILLAETRLGECRIESHKSLLLMQLRFRVQI